MQVEIKTALNFLLSYLYDKLPRRRVNLFGDELEKYLRLKLMNAVDKESRCLSINFKSNTDDIEPIDPCLIAAAKESAMDLKEILECLPKRLKIWIEHGQVSYSILEESNEIKILYNQNDALMFEENFETKTNKVPMNLKRNVKSQSQTRPFSSNFNTFNNNNSNNTKNNGVNLKPNSLNLNLNVMKPVIYSPLSPTCDPRFMRTNSPFTLNNELSSALSSSSSSSSSCSSSSASNAHLLDSQTSGDDLGVKQVKPSPSLFTTAAFAQTKFGSTKSKNNYSRKNPKMLPNEFSAYIKQKAQMVNVNSNNLLSPSMLNYGPNNFAQGNICTNAYRFSPLNSRTNI